MRLCRNVNACTLSLGTTDWNALQVFWSVFQYWAGLQKLGCRKLWKRPFENAWRWCCVAFHVLHIITLTAFMWTVWSWRPAMPVLFYLQVVLSEITYRVSPLVLAIVMCLKLTYISLCTCLLLPLHLAQGGLFPHGYSPFVFFGIISWVLEILQCSHIFGKSWTCCLLGKKKN